MLPVDKIKWQGLTLLLIRTNQQILIPDLQYITFKINIVSNDILLTTTCLVWRFNSFNF